MWSGLIDTQKNSGTSLNDARAGENVGWVCHKDLKNDKNGMNLGTSLNDARVRGRVGGLAVAPKRIQG